VLPTFVEDESLMHGSNTRNADWQAAGFPNFTYRSTSPLLPEVAMLSEVAPEGTVIL
jgi:hypothetical protein